jgi:subtilisin family serine protease
MTESGTSMATPLASGVAALYLQRDPKMTPAQVKAAMIVDSVPNAIKSYNADTPSNLLSTRKFAVVAQSPAGVDPGSNRPSSSPTDAAETPTRRSDAPSDAPSATLSQGKGTAAPAPAPTKVVVAATPAPALSQSPTKNEQCTIIFGKCTSLRDPICCSRTCWVGACMPISI